MILLTLNSFKTNFLDGFHVNRSSAVEDFNRALDAYNAFLKTASEWLASKTTEVCLTSFLRVVWTHIGKLTICFQICGI